MSANKRPSTSSLRRYLTSRPYISVADIRRRFGLDPEAMSVVSRNGTTAYIGLPEREATKLQDLWQRDEVGMQLSVEVRAPVVVGIYPMRIARFVIDQANGLFQREGAFLGGEPQGTCIAQIRLMQRMLRLERLQLGGLRDFIG